MKPNAEKPVLVQVALSFRYAFAGLWLLTRDRNMIVHLAAAAAAILLGAWLGLSRLEWIALVLAITMVVVAEAFNSAIEHTVDLASPGLHPVAAKAKDLSSAAVLIAAAGAFVVGVLLFAPRLLR